MHRISAHRFVCGSEGHDLVPIVELSDASHRGALMILWYFNDCRTGGCVVRLSIGLGGRSSIRRGLRNNIMESISIHAVLTNMALSSLLVTTASIAAHNSMNTLLLVLLSTARESHVMTQLTRQPLKVGIAAFESNVNFKNAGTKGRKGVKLSRTDQTDSYKGWA